MSNKKNYTVNEHYIARMYLREFSEIKGSGKNEKAFIWEYDLKSMKQIPDQVRVESICFEENLYEFRDKDGTFIGRNTIENVFGKLEDDTSKVIKSIKLRSQNKDCLNCTSFLSEYEKNVLIVFIIALMYRDPITIEKGISILKEENPNIPENDARNFTLLNLLPLGQDPKWDENTIIRRALENLSGMAFQVGLTSDDAIFTSDRPIVLWPSKSTEVISRPKALVFPLTSRIVLYLYPLEDVDRTGWNYLFQLDEGRIRDIQANIAICARRWIYSRECLTGEQLRIIKEARNRLDEQILIKH